MLSGSPSSSPPIPAADPMFWFSLAVTAGRTVATVSIVQMYVATVRYLSVHDTSPHSRHSYHPRSTHNMSLHFVNHDDLVWTGGLYQHKTLHAKADRHIQTQTQTLAAGQRPQSLFPVGTPKAPCCPSRHGTAPQRRQSSASTAAIHVPACHFASRSPEKIHTYVPYLATRT